MSTAEVPTSDPQRRDVKGKMRNVMGGLEVVLGELKTVVGDLQSLVSQIDVVTTNIDRRCSTGEQDNRNRRGSEVSLDRRQMSAPVLALRSTSYLAPDLRNERSTQVITTTHMTRSKSTGSAFGDARRLPGYYFKKPPHPVHPIQESSIPEPSHKRSLIPQRHSADQMVPRQGPTKPTRKTLSLRALMCPVADKEPVSRGHHVRAHSDGQTIFKGSYLPRCSDYSASRQARNQYTPGTEGRAESGHMSDRHLLYNEQNPSLKIKRTSGRSMQKLGCESQEKVGSFNGEVRSRKIGAYVRPSVLDSACIGNTSRVSSGECRLKFAASRITPRSSDDVTGNVGQKPRSQPGRMRSASGPTNRPSMQRCMNLPVTVDDLCIKRSGRSASGSRSQDVFHSLKSDLTVSHPESDLDSSTTESYSAHGEESEEICSPHGLIKYSGVYEKHLDEMLEEPHQLDGDEDDEDDDVDDLPLGSEAQHARRWKVTSSRRDNDDVKHQVMTSRDEGTLRSLGRTRQRGSDGHFTSSADSISDDGDDEGGDDDDDPSDYLSLCPGDLMTSINTKVRKEFNYSWRTVVDP